MNDTVPDCAKAQTTAAWGSDAIAELLRVLEIPYIALTPGASFRGLHDSLVNYLGNARPELLLCIHEEHAVALAHGYARVTGKPLAVALHANVGLMHATMAIFNAWCDRIPMLLLGAVGPIDAMQRRPWVDWIHTSRDLGALVRGYTKWDDLPGSVGAALEAMVRGYRLSMTPPQAPVYICLDAALQEQAQAIPPPMPALDRLPAPIVGGVPSESLREAKALLESASKPLMMIGRVSNDIGAFERRVALAERLGAVVVTDIKTGASFPTQHALHPFPPSLVCRRTRGTDGARRRRHRQPRLDRSGRHADAGLRRRGSARQGRSIARWTSTCTTAGTWTTRRCRPTDLSILVPPDALVAELLAVLGARASSRAAPWFVKQPDECGADDRGVAG